MGNNHRVFVWSSKAWYAEANNMTNDDLWGEMTIKWTSLGNEYVPQLRSFNDTWHVLASFVDLIAKAGKYHRENIAPQDFVDILIECGFVDETPYDNPYGPSEHDQLQKKLTETQERVREIKQALYEITNA